ncbi:UNVERIFIED_CONTAM: hypothetical protein FKN15_023068 [Acipenser sinensis]
MKLSPSHAYVGQDYSIQKNIGKISLEQIDPFSTKSYPLCMRHLHKALRENHHLRHGGRMQYGLFLKGIGLTLEQALQFWRSEFIKGKVDADKKCMGAVLAPLRLKGIRVLSYVDMCQVTSTDSVACGTGHQPPPVARLHSEPLSVFESTLMVETTSSSPAPGLNRKCVTLIYFLGVEMMSDAYGALKGAALIISAQLIQDKRYILLGNGYISISGNQSYDNNQLSKIGGGEPLGIDALAHRWPRHLLYAFPMLALVLLCLREVRQDLAKALLAPYWPRRIWISTLLQLLSGQPWRQPTCCDLLSQVLDLVKGMHYQLACQKYFELTHSVLDLVKGMHYQLACQKYFELTHSVDDCGFSLNHPNQYFVESQRILNGGREIKTEVTQNETPQQILTNPAPKSAAAPEENAAKTKGATKEAGCK